MLWLVLGSFALCGAVLTVVPDRKPAANRTFVDRARLRQAGMMLLGLSGTALLGIGILSALGSWASSGL